MKKILAIATSDATVLNGKKTGLWLSELTHFLAVIADKGYDFDLASPHGGKVPLDEKSAVPGELNEAVNARFLADKSFAEKLEHSLRCADVDPTQYQAIYLAGGHGTMFDFRQSKDLQRLITAIHDQGGYLTGVCHGVAGFVDSVDGSGRSIVNGKQVTGFSNIEDTIAGTKKLMPFLLEDALKEQGAHYKKNLIPFTNHVEVDGKLITGQNPQSAKGVGQALVERL